jgi:hypothetical protein
MGKRRNGNVQQSLEVGAGLGRVDTAVRVGGLHAEETALVCRGLDDPRAVRRDDVVLIHGFGPRTPGMGSPDQ